MSLQGRRLLEKLDGGCRTPLLSEASNISNIDYSQKQYDQRSATLKYECSMGQHVMFSIEVVFCKSLVKKPGTIILDSYSDACTDTRHFALVVMNLNFLACYQSQRPHITYNILTVISNQCLKDHLVNLIHVYGSCLIQADRSLVLYD